MPSFDLYTVTDGMSPDEIGNSLKGANQEFVKAVKQIDDTKLQYIISKGQSLSIGYTDAGATPINTNPLTSAYLFNGVPAISVADGVSVTGADVASTVVFSQPTRETHAYSMLSGLINDKGGTWLYAPDGRGGKKIIELNKGTQPYFNGQEMINAATARSTDLGKSGVISPFMTWIQGESDVLTETDYYKNEVVAMYNDVLTDYAAVISTPDFPMIMTQIGTSGSNKFGQAELELAKENPNFYLAGPNWPIARLHNSSATDYTHLSPEGYVILGNMIKRCVDKTVFGNEPDYQPLVPVGLTVRGKQVRVDFNVTDGELVIDKTTFTEAPGLGIQYVYTNALAQTVSKSVVGEPVISGNSVIFTFNDYLMAGGYISAGNTLTDHSQTDDIDVPCINIRNSKPVINTSSGLEWYDWCCQFYEPVKTTDGAPDPSTDNIWLYGSPRIDTTDAFITILGTSSAYFLDGTTYEVSYDSAVIDSGGVRIWVGDESHTVVTGGATVTLTRGATTRLRLQSLTGGFSGQVFNIKIRRLS